MGKTTNETLFILKLANRFFDGQGFSDFIEHAKRYTSYNAAAKANRFPGGCEIVQVKVDKPRFKNWCGSWHNGACDCK